MRRLYLNGHQSECEKLGQFVEDIIWGDHSPGMIPDREKSG